MTTKVSDRPLTYYKDGAIYKVHPSAIGAKELTVTTPEVVVTPYTNKVVKQKEYQPTMLGFSSYIKDKVTGNDTYLQDKDWVGEIKQDDRSGFEKGLAYLAQHNDNPLGYTVQTVMPSADAALALTGARYGIGSASTAIAGGAKTFVPWAITAIEHALPTALLGGVTGAVVNTASEKLTGKSFDDLAGDITNSSAGELFNPGYYVGGTTGEYLTRKGLARARKSFFDNVTPFGYNNTLPGAPSRGKEFWGFTKDFVNPRKKFDVSPSAEPKWKKRLLANNPGNTNMALDADFREEAIRKGLNLPSKYPLYEANNDGTWRYNTHFINAQRRKYGIDAPVEAESFPIIGERKGKSFLSGDLFTGNGGYVKMTEDNNGFYILEDMFDVNPFSDGRALWGIRLPGTQYIEGLQALGGKPFMLRQRFQPAGFTQEKLSEMVTNKPYK